MKVLEEMRVKRISFLRYGIFSHDVAIFVTAEDGLLLPAFDFVCWLALATTQNYMALLRVLRVKKS